MDLLPTEQSLQWKILGNILLLTKHINALDNIIQILPVVEGGILDYQTNEEYCPRWSQGWYSFLSGDLVYYPQL